MKEINLVLGALVASLVASASVAQGPDESSSATLNSSLTAADSSTESKSSEAPSTIPAAPDVGASPAQEESIAPAPRNRLIEEIIVTAQKREENLQEVPIAIQAFSAESLAARGVEDTTQLGQSVPALQFNSTAGFTTIFLRGIGTNQFIPSADPSVATYIDGVYLPLSQGGLAVLNGIQRVEVLKGPQGTLFGRNSTGGAINIVTEEPGNEFKASAEAEAGNFDAYSVKASMTNPLTDWLSFSLSGILSGKDNYYTNIFYDVAPNRLKSFRAKVNIHPTDNLSLSVTGYHAEQRGIGSLLGKNTNPSLLGRAIGIQPAEDDYTADQDLELRAIAKQDFLYGTLAWNLPWLDVKVIGSDVRSLSPFQNIDYEASRLPIAAFDGTNSRNFAKTAELQLISNDDTWGADKFKWVVGAYYLESSVGFNPAHLSVAPQGVNSILNLAGAQGALQDVYAQFFDLLSGLGNSLGIDLVQTPLGPHGLNLGFFGLLDTKSTSVYAQGTYYFTDWMDLTLGGRYQEEKRYMVKSQTTLELLSAGPTPVLYFPLGSETENNFSPKAVLSFHPSDDAMIYLSYASGFKSGTFNVVNIYKPPQYIVPEKNTTYEIGAKTKFGGGIVTLNGALFYNDIENLQTGFVSLLTGGAVSFQTAGAARTYGAEFDTTILPFPEWNPGFVLTANAAYVDAEYTNFTDGSGFLPSTGIFLGGQDFSGNKIVQTPKLTAGLGAVQTIETERGSIELAADGFHNSGYYFDSANTVKEKAYSLLNARISYLHDPWGIRVTLFGKNVLDRQYHQQQFQTDFGVINTLAAPREYGIRINWSF